METHEAVVCDLHTKGCLNAIFKISLDVFAVPVNELNVVLLPECKEMKINVEI